MALVKCSDCDFQLSKSATTCPQCGAKQPKRTPLVVWAFGALVLFVIVKGILGDDAPADSQVAVTPQAPKEPSATDEEFTLSVNVVKSIKRSLKNPNSFQLETFLIFPGGATCVEYRGTNSFNAVVPGRVVIQPKKDSIITSERGGKKFIQAWNEVCTKAGGQERARGLMALGAI